MNDEIGPVSSEAELQRNLKSYFEKHNWLAVREVSPTDSRVKADLIVKHDTYGWFGIETKYFNNDGGGKVADAHHQIISQYRGRRYINDRSSYRRQRNKGIWILAERVVQDAQREYSSRPSSHAPVMPRDYIGISK